MDPDQVLLERWRAGDEAGGRDLFRRYFDQLYRFFSNKCDEPEEMVQATFFAIVKARDQFAGRSQFRTYLFVVARNELHRHLRTLQRERAFDPELSSIAELVSTAGSKLARNQDHKILCAALRTLPVEQQTLLELHYWEELDAAALSEVFEVEPALIRTRLSRARAALREAVEASRAAPPAAYATVDDLDVWVRSTNRASPG